MTRSSKRTLATVILLSVISFAANAQTHCTQLSGAGVCTPDTSLTEAGFYPPDSSLPCVVIGQPYDTVIQFHTPDTVQGYLLNWIRILEIYNLPAGLCWLSSSSTDQINGNSTICIRITGTTNAAPGKYLLLPVGNMNVKIGIFPINFTNVNIDSIAGLGFYIRVRQPGGICEPITDIPFLENESELDVSIKLFPNPATNQLSINLGGLQAEQVLIYNVDGKLVSQTKQPAGNRIDISNLAKGVYIAEVKVREAVQRVRWVKM